MRQNQTQLLNSSPLRLMSGAVYSQAPSLSTLFRGRRRASKKGRSTERSEATSRQNDNAKDLRLSCTICRNFPRNLSMVCILRINDFVICISHKDLFSLPSASIAQSSRLVRLVDHMYVCCSTTHHVPKIKIYVCLTGRDINATERRYCCVYPIHDATSRRYFGIYYCCVPLNHTRCYIPRCRTIMLD